MENRSVRIGLSFSVMLMGIPYKGKRFSIHSKTFVISANLPTCPRVGAGVSLVPTSMYRRRGRDSSGTEKIFCRMSASIVRITCLFAFVPARSRARSFGVALRKTRDDVSKSQVRCKKKVRICNITISKTRYTYKRL